MLTSLLSNNMNPSHDLLQIYRSQVRLILAVCIVTVIGLAIAVIVFFNPSLEMSISAQRIAVALLVIHLVLHWLTIKVERRIRLAIVYIFVQVIVLFYMQTLCHYPVLLLALPPLIAEIVVIFEALWLV